MRAGGKRGSVRMDSDRVAILYPLSFSARVVVPRRDAERGAVAAAERERERERPKYGWNGVPIE